VIDPIVEILGAARKPEPDDYPIQSDPRPWDVLGGGR
jgi:hypothetical protein